MNKEVSTQAFVERVTTIHDAANAALKLDIIGHEEHAWLESIKEEIENSLYSKDGRAARTEVFGELERLNISLGEFFEAFDPNFDGTYDVRIAFAGMGTALREIREDQTGTQETWDDAKGTFISSALVALAMVCDEACENNLIGFFPTVIPGDMPTLAPAAIAM